MTIPEFKSIFYKYFKDGQKSTTIYHKLLEVIKCYLVDDEVVDTKPQKKDGQLNTFETMVSIQKLSKFIDVFNYYPIYVNSLKKKNDSDELCYIMTSNTRGSFLKAEEDKKHKSKDELHLLTLLTLVSAKLHERFKNLRAAFRFLDTNHSQSISLNEFAQAIDHLRLKLSFDDIVKLYRFIDKEGKGEVGYDEFILLTEENFSRVVDPFASMNANIQKLKDRQAVVEEKKEDMFSELDALGTEIDRLQKLEEMACNKSRYPFKFH